LKTELKDVEIPIDRRSDSGKKIKIDHRIREFNPMKIKSLTEKWPWSE
jgi:hypothetical protein